MPCAGAEAFLVMSVERARDLGLAHVLLRGAIERHNAYADDPVMVRGGWRMDRDELYAMAGAKPGDMDFVQTYDDYPVIVMMQFEDLGFCDKGDGPAFVRAHRFTWDGSFPNNTSGGQLSAGQAGAAGGFLGMTEAIRQLTGQAAGHAVPAGQARPGQRLRHGHLRPLPVHRRGDPRSSAVTPPADQAEAQEPGPAHAADQPAAVGAQPRGAGPHRGGGDGALRAAAMRGLPGRAVPAARGLPALRRRAVALARARRRGRVARRHRPCITATICSFANGCRGGSGWSSSMPGRR